MKSVFKNSRPSCDGETRSLDQHTPHSAPVDWNFQSTAPNFRGGASYQRLRQSPLSAFRTISNGFFEAEAKREYRIEAGVFGLITLLALWPMIQAVQALVHLAR